LHHQTQDNLGGGDLHRLTLEALPMQETAESVGMLDVLAKPQFSCDLIDCQLEGVLPSVSRISFIYLGQPID